jgi:hypothetical protein
MTMTTEERLAQAIADRDYWREQATGMAPCVDEIRRLTRRVVRGGTGCVVDPERVVAAVEALRADRDRVDLAAHSLALACDTARAEAAGLRDAAVSDQQMIWALGETRERLLNDVAALQAIVEGRTVPPTPDEAEAQRRAGGGWLYSRPEGCRASVAALPMTVRSVVCAADYQRETLRWWPLDANGAPCAWPVTP